MINDTIAEKVKSGIFTAELELRRAKADEFRWLDRETRQERVRHFVAFTVERGDGEALEFEKACQTAVEAEELASQFRKGERYGVSISVRDVANKNRPGFTTYRDYDFILPSRANAQGVKPVGK
jgi:hypothetical protein